MIQQNARSLFKMENGFHKVSPLDQISYFVLYRKYLYKSGFWEAQMSVHDSSFYLNIRLFRKRSMYSLLFLQGMSVRRLEAFVVNRVIFWRKYKKYIIDRTLKKPIPFDTVFIFCIGSNGKWKSMAILAENPNWSNFLWWRYLFNEWLQSMT